MCIHPTIAGRRPRVLTRYHFRPGSQASNTSTSVPGGTVPAFVACWVGCSRMTPGRPLVSDTTAIHPPDGGATMLGCGALQEGGTGLADGTRPRSARIHVATMLSTKNPSTRAA